MAVEHPLIKEGLIEDRAYQKNIADIAKNVSTLVVLPTGMGKTIIALRAMAEIKNREPDAKILFMAPTKPLVHQHARDIEGLLKIGEPVVFTGEVRPKEREKQWTENDIIVSTPQVIRNDLMAGRISLDDVSLTIFDEAHRGVGGYAYVFIGERYLDTGGLAMGMTASPGSETEQILNVCENLGFQNVEIRTKYDADVINYIQKRDVEWIDVRLPSKLKKIVNKLKSLLERYVKKLKGYGFLERKRSDRVTRKDLINTSRKIQAQINSSGDGKLYNASSIVASAIKLDHAIDQAETQGPDVLMDYLEKLKNEADSRGGSKAAKRLVNSREMSDVLATLKNLDEEHPKIGKTVEIVREQLDKKPDSKIIVFTTYRNTAKRLNRRLAAENKVKPVRFVGQADKEGDKGLKQKDQIKVIEDFEEGKYNVLVSTSVGEEGLDIPATDLVVFYEPVPSEIRTIQRRGRTARKRKGKVAILITKKTRDEGYYWSSKNKEKKMWRNLRNLQTDLEGKITVDASLNKDKADSYKVVKKKSKKQLKRLRGKMESDEGGEAYRDKSQRSLNDFSGGDKEKKEGEEDENKKEITIDVREQNSQVVRELSRSGLYIKTSQLSVGDYIISEDIAVERKSVDDFLESLIDGRLFSQVKELSTNYRKPVMIIEGDGLYTKRNIDKKAVSGALASIATDFRMPVLTAKDGEETGQLLSSLISRSGKEKKEHSTRKDKSSMSDRDTKKFILEGLPNVSGTLADRLLEHFGSVRAVFEADKEELQKVKGIGPSTAERIIKIIE